MKQLEFLVEDKIEEILSFIPPLVNEQGNEFKHYFSHGPSQDLNSFIAKETEQNVYPLIWLVYPYTETRNDINVTVSNLRLILAVDNSVDMLNKQRLMGSYSKALYPLFFSIQKILTKANNIEVVDNEYRLTKFPNYGEKKHNHDTFDALTTTIWDALAVDFSFKLNKFCHKLKK